MLAVLADAIYTFRRTARATDVRGRRLFAETAAWFVSSSTATPFAFVTICDTLGLDAAYVRDSLRRWRHARENAGPWTTPVPAPTRAAV